MTRAPKIVDLPSLPPCAHQWQRRHWQSTELSARLRGDSNADKTQTRAYSSIIDANKRKQSTTNLLYPAIFIPVHQTYFFSSPTATIGIDIWSDLQYWFATKEYWPLSDGSKNLFSVGRFIILGRPVCTILLRERRNSSFESFFIRFVEWCNTVPKLG